jgi:hypothetical protein
LLDATPLEAKILARLARHAPADAEAVAEAIGGDVVDVRAALATLADTGRVRLASDGRAHVAFGWSRRRTLPADLWRALLPADRLYSRQEIVTLRTAIPILQFARAKLGEFADHGPAHALRVKSFATQLSYVLGVTRTERHLLRAAALFHDVGNITDRHRHHLISQETVERLAASGELPFSAEEAALIGVLCRWHRAREQDFDPERIDTLRDEAVRTGLLASLLRVADAMDIDYRRSDYTEAFARVLKLFFPDELPYWTSLEEILGVRARCTPRVTLQVFVRRGAGDADNMQITMLRKDLASTRLDWCIEVTPIDDAALGPPASVEPARGPALIAFPFDPHSLVMAALSRTHLRAAGWSPVELLSYPDTPEGADWLWGQALPDADRKACTHLIVIGDRPNQRRQMSDVLRVVKHWRAAGVRISLLNRHEGSWPRVPRVLGLGAEVTLGGDWAYFWGDPGSAAALAWARVASLCTRDPTQSTVGITADEQTLTQGLLAAVYDAVEHAAGHMTGLTAEAETIVERIAADDRAWFMERANGFQARYALALSPSRIHGRVLLFEEAPGPFAPAAYWALEAAVERYGRAPVRGIHFNIPYAIGLWPADAGFEMLAVSHWREEEAIPIRLLYPTDLGPAPEGHESAFRVRLAPDQAPAVVDALVAACNKG